MNSTLKTIRSVALCALSITFLKSATAQAQSCPPDAYAASAYVTSVAYRQDGITPVGTGFVRVGETILLQMSVIYVPLDPINLATMAAFQGGAMRLHLGTTDYDVTPPDGVSLVGPPECLGVPVKQSVKVPYAVTSADATAGTILVRADYTGGDAGNGLPVSGNNHTVVRVRPEERLQIRLTTGVALLQFTGVPGATYRVQAASEFSRWTDIASVTADSSGMCRLEEHHDASAPCRLYRYVSP